MRSEVFITSGKGNRKNNFEYWQIKKHINIFFFNVKKVKPLTFRTKPNNELKLFFFGILHAIIEAHIKKKECYFCKNRNEIFQTQKKNYWETLWSILFAPKIRTVSRYCWEEKKEKKLLGNTMVNVHYSLPKTKQGSLAVLLGERY